MMGVIVPDFPIHKNGVSSTGPVELVTNGYWVYRSADVKLSETGYRGFGAGEPWATRRGRILKPAALNPMMFPENIDKYQQATITSCMSVDPFEPVRKDRHAARLFVVGSEKYAWINELYLIDKCYQWRPQIFGPASPVIFYDNDLDCNVMAVVMPMRIDSDFFEYALRSDKARKAFNAKQKKR